MKTYRCDGCDNRCTLTFNDDTCSGPRGCGLNKRTKGGNPSWAQIENQEVKLHAKMERMARENEQLKHELQNIHEDRMHYLDKYVNLHRWIKNFLSLGESGMEAIWDEKREHFRGATKMVGTSMSPATKEEDE